MERNLIFIKIILCILIITINCQEDINELRDSTSSVCLEPEKKNYDKITLGYITPWSLNGKKNDTNIQLKLI